jgi:phenylpropionate dioxygenase-like ring-hydroxylating dioxygenase large terminal subunit
MATTHPLMDDAAVVERILNHIDRRTTDVGEGVWREPVKNYTSAERLKAEVEVMRRSPTAFCPSAALPETGSYLAREAAGTPLVAVRNADGSVQVFRNSCRHRGMQLADGAGCEKAFVCRYHGWTYGLDGTLLHVPHEFGFPGLDKSLRGLVPVASTERDGFVFVTQDEPLVEPGEFPSPLSPRHKLFRTNEQEIPANWKILAEGFLEGYHIRSTHRDTFYPVQFDNLNVVESFGANNRIAFPYRRINKLREIAPANRSADGMLTYVYHLFPNVIVATFPTNVVNVILEPLAIDRTRMVTYTLTDRDRAKPEESANVKRGQDFVDPGAAEDRAVACAIQRGLAGGANEFFEFGRFESAIGHFHRTLDAALAAGEASR